MHEQEKPCFSVNKGEYWKWTPCDGADVPGATVISFEPQNIFLLSHGIDLIAQKYDDSTHQPIGAPIILAGISFRWSTIEAEKRIKVDRLCEIGVSYGNNAWRMMERLRPKEAALVDPYIDIPENQLAGGEKLDPDLPYRMARQLLSGHPAYFYKEKSCEAYLRFADEYFDFIYIDGDHSFDGCRQDIDLWLPKLRKGGIMAGDDYHKDGVKPAVEACFKKYEVSPNGYEWLIVKE